MCIHVILTTILLLLLTVLFLPCHLPQKAKLKTFESDWDPMLIELSCENYEVKVKEKKGWSFVFHKLPWMLMFKNKVWEYRNIKINALEL